MPIPYKNQLETDLESFLYCLPYAFTSGAGRAIKGLKMRYKGIAKIDRCFAAFTTVKMPKNFLKSCATCHLQFPGHGCIL